MASAARRRQQQGFTIIEMVATIAILAIALVSVASIVSLGTSRSADTLLETRAIALGYAYLDEILGRRFDERSERSGIQPCYGLAPGPTRPCTDAIAFGPDTGEGDNRARWDDVDDYHGRAEGDGETTPLLDAAGNARPGYENFHVEIAVRYAGADTAWASSETEAKHITVTVRLRSQNEGWSFSAYKGNY
jgi:MSHA pilin protein MshD